MPFNSSFSSRDPTPTQIPIEIDLTPAIDSVIIFKPLFRVVSLIPSIDLSLIIF